MSNWSRTSKYMDHGREYVLSNGFAIPLFNNIPQAAGINDKKWDKWYMIPCSDTNYIKECFCQFKIECARSKLNMLKAAKAKPEFTPEQQEMIDFLSWNACIPTYVKKKYIEIINKYK